MQTEKASTENQVVFGVLNAVESRIAGESPQGLKPIVENLDRARWTRVYIYYTDLLEYNLKVSLETAK